MERKKAFTAMAYSFIFARLLGGKTMTVTWGSSYRTKRSLALALAGFVVFCATTVEAAPGPITVFVAKKIVTMVPGRASATAVAVRDGRIVSVGSLEDLAPWLKTGPYTINKTLADKVLYPGFIEAHGHPLLGGIEVSLPLLTYLPVSNAYGPDFPGVKTRAEVIATLIKYVKAAKTPDETVLVWGYDVIAMGGEHLDKTQLDKISATQPILIWDASAHYVYANSAALKKYKITKANLAINGVMAGPDGEPNGQFLGTTAAGSIMQGAVPALLEPAAATASTKAFIDLSRKNGITTTSELVYGAVNLPFEEAFVGKYFNNPDNPVRLVVVTDVATITAAKGEGAVAFAQSLPTRNTDRVIFSGVKFFADDSFLSFGMQVTNPGYTDGRVGIWITPPDKMVAAFTPWWNAGFQIHVHSNGNASNTAVISALAQLQAAHPRFGHRFTIEHYGLSTAENARQLAALGGQVSVNPYYIYDRAELNEAYLGTDRADGAAAFKTLIDAGVPVAMHSDTPIGPPRPLEWVWIAVNRFGRSGKVHGPDERVSVDQALRMITIDSAYMLGVDDRLGSIAAGKYADFTVLDADPRDVPKEAIRDIKVWGTVNGGKLYPASDIHP